MGLSALAMVPAASDLHFAFGRQQLADGARSVPRVTSGSQKTGCANRNFNRLDPRGNHSARGPGRAGLRNVPWGVPGRLRNSRGLKPHPGRTDFPKFLPIWGRTFPYHGNVAGGQLHWPKCLTMRLCSASCAGLPWQTRQIWCFTNRRGCPGFWRQMEGALQRCGAPLMCPGWLLPPVQGVVPAPAVRRLLAASPGSAFTILPPQWPNFSAPLTWSTEGPCPGCPPVLTTILHP